MKLLLAIFVDFSSEETEQKSPFESSLKDVTETSSSKDTCTAQEVSQNGAAFEQFAGSSQESQSTGKAPGLSVELPEKMMDDPTVQKMVYPYLPEDMREPAFIKCKSILDYHVLKHQYISLFMYIFHFCSRFLQLVLWCNCDVLSLSQSVEL